MSDHAIKNAEGWLSSVLEMLAKLDAAEANEDHDAAEEAREEIQESPLSVQVRGGWYQPGDEDKGGAPEEYEILLTTGGPALRLTGQIGEWAQPSSARLQWQDWGTRWTDHVTTCEADDALLRYAQQFYYGEG